MGLLSNIDPKKFPTLHKAYQLEKEAEKVRCTLKYKQELHLFFPPSYTQTQISEAQKEIDRYYKKGCGSYCACDGYCRTYPQHAFHIMEKLKDYHREGKRLGL